MTNKKVLVTGADGFIGSHLTEMLIRAGYDVRAFVMYNSLNSLGNLENASAEIMNSLDVNVGDIRDSYCVMQAMKGCDIVFHLAALIAIPYSYQSPGSYIETNITGTLNILQAARELGLQKVIQTSTSEVYGTAKFVPITEEHPLQGQSPYSASKIGADQLALSFYNSFATPVTVVRPFNTYGPRQSARAIIPATIVQIAAGLETIKLGALHPTRDFNYVTDTAKGFIAAAESEHSNGEVINIGSNYEISIGDTVALIAEVMDKKITIEQDTTRLRPKGSEVDRLWADNSKAKRLLDWEPEYGGREGFKRGITETVNWFVDKSNLKGYKAKAYNI
ncbi:MAG: SDR family NAD(P)-dependent oxidoreductase [Leptolyngbya sp.]|nr:SDR family NAD(P)-dependent oxidoreductase [Candidatus Melainabacteria bacterium]